MPIIIWGSRGITSQVETGSFYCPHCDANAEYELKQVRPFFTLFFIPIFPIGGGQRFVQCRDCGQTFREGVLDMKPPTEGERLMAQLYQELRTGSSLETVRKKLVGMGMEAPKAQRVVEEMAGQKTWTCGGCGEQYLESVKKCLRCQA